MLSSTLRTSHACNHGEINKSASYDLVRKSTLKLDMCQVESDEILQESETEKTFHALIVHCVWSVERVAIAGSLVAGRWVGSDTSCFMMLSQHRAPGRRRCRLKRTRKKEQKFNHHKHL